MTSVDFSLDQVLAERYRLHGLLGHGGMSDVYRADDLIDGGQVALKIVRPGDPSFARRLVQEARARSSGSGIRAWCGCSTQARSMIVRTSRWNSSRDRHWSRCYEAGRWLPPVPLGSGGSSPLRSCTCTAPGSFTATSSRAT